MNRTYSIAPDGGSTPIPTPTSGRNCMSTYRKSSRENNSSSRLTATEWIRRYGPSSIDGGWPASSGHWRERGLATTHRLLFSRKYTDAYTRGCVYCKSKKRTGARSARAPVSFFLISMTMLICRYLLDMAEGKTIARF